MAISLLKYPLNASPEWQTGFYFIVEDAIDRGICDIATGMSAIKQAVLTAKPLK